MKKKILIADDEPKVVTLLAARLRANDYDVVAAYDGAQVIAMAHKEHPDLIIMDIKMPAGSGINAFQKLKISAQTGAIPVIFITAFANEKIKQQVNELGAEGFISKPFEAKVLLEMVRKVLSEDADADTIIG